MDQQERIERAASLDQKQSGALPLSVEEHESGHVLGGIEAARIILVALAATAVWFRVWEPFPRVSLIGVLGVLIGGWPIFKEAAGNAAARRMTMELSMSIALVAAAAISQFFTALIITLFVLIAEVLEGMTVSRGRRAIRDLMDFLPRSVTVRSAGGVRETSDSIELTSRRFRARQPWRSRSRRRHRAERPLICRPGADYGRVDAG